MILQEIQVAIMRADLYWTEMQVIEVPVWTESTNNGCCSEVTVLLFSIILHIHNLDMLSTCNSCICMVNYRHISDDCRICKEMAISVL
jgi:hypothetical protein